VNIAFTSNTSPGFSVGIDRGEIIFIVGGSLIALRVGFNAIVFNAGRKN
jgi:hypothetical protein